MDPGWLAIIVMVLVVVALNGVKFLAEVLQQAARQQQGQDARRRPQAQQQQQAPARRQPPQVVRARPRPPASRPWREQVPVLPEIDAIERAARRGAGGPGAVALAGDHLESRLRARAEKSAPEVERFDLWRRLDDLTPLQQAVVLAEIVGPPRSLSGGAPHQRRRAKPF